MTLSNSTINLSSAARLETRNTPLPISPSPRAGSLTGGAAGPVTTAWVASVTELAVTGTVTLVAPALLNVTLPL